MNPDPDGDASAAVRRRLGQGLVIPAHPLALTAARKLDERRQRALTRYYIAAGAGAVAVGVHTTQFAIRESRFGLFQPVLELAAGEIRQANHGRPDSVLAIGGIVGPTRQAVSEAALLRDLGYDAGLLSLAALPDAVEDELVAHCRAVAEILPVMGFYLQPAVGGRMLSYGFWRRFCAIENVVAIKIAPFNRYQTLDVVRAAAESGRDDIALYTGNDDNIVADLVTHYRFTQGGAAQVVERRIVGGLLGHWAVWTRRAVELLARCHSAGAGETAGLLREGVAITDCNAAFFDAEHRFAGCIAGLHEVLRRQGLLEGVWCLDPDEGLSPDQSEAIDRVYAAYPHLNDDAFVAAHLDEWLRG